MSGHERQAEWKLVGFNYKPNPNPTSQSESNVRKLHANFM